LGVTLLLLALMEGSLRLVWRAKRAGDRAEIAARSGFRGAAWAHDYVDELYVDVRADWWPYVHWRGVPHAGRYINIDEDGLRRTPQSQISQSSAAASVPKRTIWLFGGSTVWGWGARDEQTIAAHLARELTGAGQAVEVVNYGQIGYVSTQEVIALSSALRRGARPDVVVFLNGYNDLIAALQEGVAGLPQNESNRRAEFNMRLPGALAAETRRSATMWLVKGLLRRASGAPDSQQSFGGPDQPTLEMLGKDVIEVYAENLRLVEQIRGAHGFDAFYYWQPVAIWKKQLVGDERAAAKDWPALEALLVNVRGLFATTPPLSDNSRFRDLTGLFDDSPEPVFIDTCHFSEEENQTVAREIAKDVAPALQARAAASAP
jgi:lysophospholipase L1-like esterase